jgi:colicin import membrane protein
MEATERQESSASMEFEKVAHQ